MTYLTLSMYLIAGALNACFCILMLMLARVKSQSRLMTGGAIAVAFLALAQTVSGFGPELPRGWTVIGSNALLLSATVVTHGLLAAYLRNLEGRVDWFGWAIVACSVPAFAYWGLLEPNGSARSAVFSFAATLISTRTTVLSFEVALKRRRNIALWVVVILVGLWSLWMLGRGFYMLTVEPHSGVPKAGNPTSWETVVLSTTLSALITACFIWLEFAPLHESEFGPSRMRGRDGLLQLFRNRVLALWATIASLVIAVVGVTALYAIHEIELEANLQLQRARDSNSRHVVRTIQVLSQVDTVLNAVRIDYLRSRSPAETEAFIERLPFDRSIIKQIQLMDMQGNLLIAHDSVSSAQNPKDRDFFKFHRENSADRLFIGSVESGPTPGSKQFPVTRRIAESDGSRVGIVMAAVSTEALALYFLDSTSGNENVVSMLGADDHKPRASSMGLEHVAWGTSVASPVWDLLRTSPEGLFESAGPIDSVRRRFVYKQLPDLPLVMVTGFSMTDVRKGVLAHAGWAVVAPFAALAIILAMAAWLTVEIARRNEQAEFLAMLSHELKTPLSVLRMALGSDRPLSAGTRKHVLQAVYDMDAIVLRCLQADRLQSGLDRTLTVRCQLDQILHTLRGESAEPERIAIRIQAPVEVDADPQLLHLVLHNLLDNALKYSPPSDAVSIELFTGEGALPGWACVRFINAIGSAGAPEPSQVFQKYYRSPLAHSKTGSGLGLHLVQMAARLINATVHYEPDPAGRNVRFELRLPLGAGRALRL